MVTYLTSLAVSHLIAIHLPSASTRDLYSPRLIPLINQRSQSTGRVHLLSLLNSLKRYLKVSVVIKLRDSKPPLPYPIPMYSVSVKDLFLRFQMILPVSLHAILPMSSLMLRTIRLFPLLNLSLPWFALLVRSPEHLVQRLFPFSKSNIISFS